MIARPARPSDGRPKTAEPGGSRWAVGPLRRSDQQPDHPVLGPRLALAGVSFRALGWKDSDLSVLKDGRRQRIGFFAAGLAEVPQEVQRAALRHRAQLWQGLVR